MANPRVERATKGCDQLNCWRCWRATPDSLQPPGTTVPVPTTSHGVAPVAESATSTSALLFCAFASIPETWSRRRNTLTLALTDFGTREAWTLLCGEPSRMCPCLIGVHTMLRVYTTQRRSVSEKKVPLCELQMTSVSLVKGAKGEDGTPIGIVSSHSEERGVGRDSTPWIRLRVTPPSHPY
eukprot:scaffold7357_cov195-Pinguiococcus_pyrenoidosus.AAC.7